MSRDPGPRRPPIPLDAAALEQLALAYVGRFATTEAKLARYLQRKLRERGWAEPTPPAVATIVERCARLGYVDDAAFAAARGQALARRGLGERRVGHALAAAGIAPEVAEPVRARARDEAEAAALAFARRRRLGAYARGPRDDDQRRRDLAAMVRAGHPFALARQIVGADPDGADPDG